MVGCAQRQQVNDVERQMLKLDFGLEPIIEFTTRLPAVFEIQLKGAGAYFGLGWLGKYVHRKTSFVT